MINKSDYSIFKDATAWLPGVPHWRLMCLGTKELINKLKYVHLFFYVYSSCDNWKMLLVFKRSSIWAQMFYLQRSHLYIPIVFHRIWSEWFGITSLFLQKTAKRMRSLLVQVWEKNCWIFIVEQKFNILNELRGCNILCTCWIYQQIIRSSC